MKKIIALFLAVTMLTCSTVTANAEGLNSKETPAEITTKTTDISTGEIEDVEVQKNPSVFVGDNFEVSFHVTSKWDTAFNANVTITNTSDTGIDNWAVQFDIPHKITNIWNGVIDSKESGTYIIKNTGYNKKLNPGSSVSFGFSADTTEGKIVYPVSYDLLGTQIQSTLDTSEIGFQVTNDWKFAFNGEIQIKNISEKPIEDWQLEFDFDHNITSFWEANILSHEGNHYIIKNRGYNANIQPGKTLVLGFHGNPGNVEIEPKNYVLTYMGMETEEEIQIDLNGEYNPIENKIDLSWICNNEQLLFDVLISNDDEKYSVITSIENKNSYTYNIVDNNTDFYFKIRFIQEDGVVVESKTLYFQQIINDETDTDGDGLSDYYERQLGTDINKGDTDGDSLSDYIEVTLIATDPTKEDTDDNGTLDGDEDADSDGLTNLEEITLGIDPNNEDSDFEGLLDGEEVNKYGTDPLKEDTEEDGLTDYEEVQLHLDPQNNDSDDDGIPDIEEKVQQAVSHNITNKEKKEISNVTVSMDATGYLPSTTDIEDMYEIDFLSSDVVGLVGVPIEITSTSDFNQATITFTYDESELGDTKEDNLAIMWHDVENSCYKVLENSVLDKENNTVRVDTTHFSTYMVVDIIKWFKAWSVQLNYTASSNISKNYNTVLAIDCSSSMCNQDQANGLTCNRASIISKYYEMMNSKDKISSVEFFNQKYWLKYLMLDKQSLLQDNSNEKFEDNFDSDFNDYLNEFCDETETTDYDSPIRTSIEELKKQTDENKKVIVLVSDGKGIISDSTLELAKNSDINIYTIGIGTNADEVKLKYISDFTGGEYYKAITDDQLIDIYSKIVARKDIDLTDIDGDGLADVFETVGMRIETGEIIHTDPLKWDTDGDGLKDGDEIYPMYKKTTSSDSLIVKKKNNKKYTAKIKPVYKKMTCLASSTRTGVPNPDEGTFTWKSDPLNVDDDYDGIKDSDDIEPSYGVFQGTMNGYYDVNNARYRMNYKKFFGDSKDYDSSICSSSLIFANTIYDAGGFKYTRGGSEEDGSGKVTTIKQLMEHHGFTNIKDYSLSSEYDDDNISEIGIGYHKVKDVDTGKKINVVAIIIRGTNGTIEEWSSNFDMGNPKEWSSKYHKGFYKTEQRILDYVDTYVSRNFTSKSKLAYWVTGHSRGAALANLLSADLIDRGCNVFAYTFATPSTTISDTCNDTKYNSIFNFTNKSDFVTYVPLSNWGFSRFGKTKSMNIIGDYKSIWIKRTKRKAYNALDDDIITKAVDKIYDSCASNWSEVYQYGDAQNITDEQYDKISQRAKKYCQLKERNSFLGKHKGYKICPSLAFFFQLGAEALAGSKDEKQNASKIIKEFWNSDYVKVLIELGNSIAKDMDELDIPDKLDKALVGDGHATATYYVLSHQVKNNYLEYPCW